MPNSHFFGPVVVGLVVTCFAACDGTQALSLTAEDFRFVPDLVLVDRSSPLTLTIYNAGREVHEFDSPVLIYAAAIPSA